MYPSGEESWTSGAWEAIMKSTIFRSSPSQALPLALSELPQPEHHSGSAAVSKIAFPSTSRNPGWPPEWKMITKYPAEWNQSPAAWTLCSSPILQASIQLYRNSRERKGVCKWCAPNKIGTTKLCWLKTLQAQVGWRCILMLSPQLGWLYVFHIYLSPRPG